MKTKTFFRFFLLGVMTLFTLGAWAQTETPDYLCFTATGASSVTLNKNDSPAEVTLQTSKDGTNWSDYAFGTPIDLADGEKVYFRNAADGVTGFSTAFWNYYQFAMTGSIAASGNVMSLVDKSVATTTIPCDCCFCKLFYNCTALTNAADLKLPATELKSNCYDNMFFGCTSLTTAPTILLATTLASSCYSSMFSGCTSLKTAPTLLPATTLASYCYSGMFKGCTELTAAPALNATTLAERCCSSMFEGCINLATAPTLLLAETLANECYSSMFKGCEKLTAAPELNATTLASSCCSSMFEGCTGIETAPVLLATTLASSCYSAMFKGCTSLETAPALPAKTTAQSCYSSMFEGCTKLTTAPELPATKLVTSDYFSMFKGCTNLNYVKIAFTGTLGNNYSMDWLNNVASTGTFVCPAEAGIASRNNHTVPAGWKVTYEITAHQDPENNGNYYATFYSSTEACQVPEGVTAYTAEVDGSVLKLTPIAGNIIPAEEGVVLKRTSTDGTEATAHFLLMESTGGTKSDNNALTGTSTFISKTKVTQYDYALSLGTDGVGFYKWEGKEIGAHKAYLKQSSGAKVLVFDFDEGTTTGIKNHQPSTLNPQPSLYNLNGVRVDDSYKGIVIKNGKKFYQR